MHKSHRIIHADGVWTVGGRERPDLSGCQDLYFGWPPITNLIPIRGLDTAVGESFEILAAWLRFPE